MKYVKSISLFFVYPLCCFLAGLFVGLSFLEIIPESTLQKDGLVSRNEIYETDKIRTEQQYVGLSEQPSDDLLLQQMNEDSESVSGRYIINQMLPGSGNGSNISASQTDNLQSDNLQTGNLQTDALQSGFYIMNLNNYVVVYYSDKKTVFLSTAICVEDLPGDVQAGLLQGILIPDEGSLYDFLENYTS